MNKANLKEARDMYAQVEKRKVNKGSSVFYSKSQRNNNGNVITQLKLNSTIMPSDIVQKTALGNHGGFIWSSNEGAGSFAANHERNIIDANTADAAFLNRWALVLANVGRLNTIVDPVGFRAQVNAGNYVLNANGTITINGVNARDAWIQNAGGMPVMHTAVRANITVGGYYPYHGGTFVVTHMAAAA